MQDQTQIFGIRAIIEAINAGETIDKVFLQKGLKGELFTELESILRKNDVNCSYVPVEKLNRLTRSNHQGAVAQISPIEFHDMEQLVLKVMESGKTPLSFSYTKSMTYFCIFFLFNYYCFWVFKITINILK